MKAFVAILLLALLAFAYADKSKESVEPANAESEKNAARDKRGLLLGAAYTAPIAYSAYSAPVAYSAGYSVPYAYSAYRAYPYYSAYSSPYILG